MAVVVDAMIFVKETPEAGDDQNAGRGDRLVAPAVASKHEHTISTQRPRYYEITEMCGIYRVVISFFENKNHRGSVRLLLFYACRNLYRLHNSVGL